MTSYHNARRKRQDGLKRALKTPTHFFAVSGEAAGELASEEAICAYQAALDKAKSRHDFVVVDTPGSYTALAAHAHRYADTLVTPVNDSFIDFDVLAKLDPDTLDVIKPAHYALLVREARRQRRADGEGLLDWIVVRNRLSSISSRNEKRVYECLRDLGMLLGYRLADGVGERVIFREYFHLGLTALDTRPDTEQAQLSLSHVAARTEVRRLIEILGLPINDAGRRRQETRRRWLHGERPKVALPPIFAD